MLPGLEPATPLPQGGTAIQQGHRRTIISDEQALACHLPERLRGRSRAVGRADVNSGCATFPEYQTQSHSTPPPPPLTPTTTRGKVSTLCHPWGADPEKQPPTERMMLTTEEENFPSLISLQCCFLLNFYYYHQDFSFHQHLLFQSQFCSNLLVLKNCKVVVVVVYLTLLINQRASH